MTQWIGSFRSFLSIALVFSACLPLSPTPLPAYLRAANYGTFATRYRHFLRSPPADYCVAVCPRHPPSVAIAHNTIPLQMTCHVLGDQQDPNTLDVYPGDVLTFDFHHNNRTDQ